MKKAIPLLGLRLDDRTGSGNSESFERAFRCLYDVFDRCCFFEPEGDQVFGPIPNAGELWSFHDFEGYVDSNEATWEDRRLVCGSSLSRFGRWVSYTEGLYLVLFDESSDHELSAAEDALFCDQLDKWCCSLDWDMWASEFGNGVTYPSSARMVIVNRDGILWDLFTHDQEVVRRLKDYHQNGGDFVVEDIIASAGTSS